MSESGFIAEVGAEAQFGLQGSGNRHLPVHLFMMGFSAVYSLVHYRLSVIKTCYQSMTCRPAAFKTGLSC